MNDPTTINQLLFNPNESNVMGFCRNKKTISEKMDSTSSCQNKDDLNDGNPSVSFSNDINTLGKTVKQSKNKMDKMSEQLGKDIKERTMDNTLIQSQIEQWGDGNEIPSLPKSFEELRFWGEKKKSSSKCVDKEDAPTRTESEKPSAEISVDDMSFLGKKKKRSSKKPEKLKNIAPNEIINQNTSASNDAHLNEYTEDTLYEYSQLLARLMENVKQFRTDEVTELKLHPPMVTKQGRRVVFMNFHDISKRLRRSPDQMMKYFSIELGAVCTLNAAKQLLVKGKFNPAHFQHVLTSYCKEYVICPVCKSHDTILLKKDRLTYLNCDACMSRRTVTTLKPGFVAKTKNIS